MNYIAPLFLTTMSKKRFEKYLVALLFVMVLVVFSFAERDSKKLERLYTTAHQLKKAKPTDVASGPVSKESSKN